MDRRDFIKTSAILGGTALASAIAKKLAKAGEEQFISAHDYPLNEPEHIIYSTCLQCNTGCGIKVKILDSVAVKIDGNPLAPQTLYPHLPYNKLQRKLTVPCAQKGKRGCKRFTTHIG